jgi:hypothetical protein
MTLEELRKEKAKVRAMAHTTKQSIHTIKLKVTLAPFEEVGLAPVFLDKEGMRLAYIMAEDELKNTKGEMHFINGSDRLHIGSWGLPPSFIQNVKIPTPYLSYV